MLGRVVVENGVKKIVPLTADCGSGNPVGTVIAVYSNKVPNGYLPCNGVAFDTAQFPVLYALLGDDHTPDLRECTLKGIGESGRTVGAHVKAGGLAVGEFIDDQVQEHKHDYVVGEVGVSGTPAYYTGSNTVVNFHNAHSTNNNGRSGATTEVKAVGVNFCIKATSGINENQADNVLSALSPVDVVALNNVHSVTSNAVYEKTFAIERIMAFRLTIASPANVITYVKIKMPNYHKSVECPLVLCQAWATLFGLTEGSVAKIIYGGRYGIKGISWTGYETDDDNFFWLQITNYRHLCLISTHQMQIEARTTTPPSGVTFTEPV